MAGQAGSNEGGEMKRRAAKLVLSDGTEYPGFSFGAPISVAGEVRCGWEGGWGGVGSLAVLQ